jgi:hypothetical protein
LKNKHRKPAAGGASVLASRSGQRLGLRHPCAALTMAYFFPARSVWSLAPDISLAFEFWTLDFPNMQGKTRDRSGNLELCLFRGYNSGQNCSELFFQPFHETPKIATR